SLPSDIIESERVEGAPYFHIFTRPGGEPGDLSRCLRRVSSRADICGSTKPEKEMERFPDGFLWGTAASAFQIEGAAALDGRGESVWDRFCRTPGAIADGSTGDVACDHYHRFPEDVALMQRLGVGAYRLSIAWPRVLPTGRGSPNAAGLDFYDRLIEAVLAAGIEPWICLHHWDMPQAMEERGGWRNRDVAQWFGDYAHLVARRFGDRVRRFAPINEPNVLLWVAYNAGVHAPGQRSRGDCLAAIHHINLAHGLAIDRLRDTDPAPECGNIVSLGPVAPARDDATHRDAAELVDCLWRRVMVDPIKLGRYPEPLADELAPLVQPGDMELIAQPLEFFGLNHYNRMYARPDPATSFGVGEAPPPEGVPVTDMGWQIDPDAFLEQLRDVRDRYDDPEIYITENGAAFPDRPDSAGAIDDSRRVAFLHDYLAALNEAIAEGVKVRGYFVWSLLDNFEWDQGYSKRFGLVYVDYRTLARTPKRSFDYMHAVIQENALVPIPE
ncbi:MAG: GH1 family beta-glucosidase, partial [Alphaproteobacteria bacterium]